MSPERRDMSMAKVLIIYHSQGGNTKVAAEIVAEGVREVKGSEPKVVEGL